MKKEVFLMTLRKFHFNYYEIILNEMEEVLSLVRQRKYIKWDGGSIDFKGYKEVFYHETEEVFHST